MLCHFPGRNQPVLDLDNGPSQGLPQCSLSAFSYSGFAVSDVEVVEGRIEGNHMVVNCTININSTPIKTIALLDMGDTGYAFIDQKFVHHHNALLEPVKLSCTLEVIDGRPITSGDIIHIIRFQINIDEHSDEIPMFITHLCHISIVLGIS